MKYIHENTIGKPLQCLFKPYQRIVNNGCVIETQSEELLWQLYQNEKEGETQPIDWHLFKESGTVLIDNHGRRYACVRKSQGHVTLAEMKYDLIIFLRNDDGDRLEFVFHTAEDFIRSFNDDCMGDHEILYVEWKDKVIYSSLGIKGKDYNDAVRTVDVYNWFRISVNIEECNELDREDYETEKEYYVSYSGSSIVRALNEDEVCERALNELSIDEVNAYLMNEDGTINM